MDQRFYAEWIGRVSTKRDLVTAAMLARLSAVLDHPSPPWPVGEAPPLAHWLVFLPDEPQSQMGEDGHPRRGGF